MTSPGLERTTRRRRVLRAASVVVALFASWLLFLAYRPEVDAPQSVPARAAEVSRPKAAPDSAHSPPPDHGPLVTEHARMMLNLMDYEEGHGTIVCWVGDILPDGHVMSTGAGFTMAMITEGWLWASTVTPDGSVRARAEEPVSALVTWEGVPPGVVGPCTVSERREAAGLYGQITGWDGTGELIVDGCWCGAQVEADARYACAVEAGVCWVETVWYRDGFRARGARVQVELRPGEELEVTLRAPDPEAFAPLSLAELHEEREAMEVAERLLGVLAPGDTDREQQMADRWAELELQESEAQRATSEPSAP